MRLLDRDSIIKQLKSEDDNSLFLDPLLDEGRQVGAATIDLRLGYDFAVSILTRKPYISVSKSDDSYRDTASYFQFTRRSFGEKFVLYPGQVVLATSLEYVSLPSNVYADVLSRSSYTRLGIHLNTMVQPGFRGCIPLELFNHSNNAVELVVGARLVQIRLFEVSEDRAYGQYGRKYYGNVRPTISRAAEDSDLDVLGKVEN